MKTPRILAATIASLLAPALLHAQTWDGGGINGGNTNWSIGTNWTGVPDNTAPVNNGTANVAFAGFVDINPGPNLDQAWNVNSVTFNAGSGAFVLGSSAGATLTVGAGGIANNTVGGITQTISHLVSVGVPATTFAGLLNFTNTVALNTSALNVLVNGAGSASFANFSGTGSVTKTGNATMLWAPTATTSADITVSDGTLNTREDGSTDIFDGSASIAVNGTGTLNINEDMILDGGAQMTRQGGTFKIAGNAGFKTLTIQGGSDFIITGNHSEAGGSYGNITVTGAGSTMQTISAGILTVPVGQTMTVLNGGSVSAAGGIAVGPSQGQATLTVDGNGSSVSAGGTSAVYNGYATFSNDAFATLAAFDVGTGFAVARLQILTGADLTQSGNLQIQGGGIGFPNSFVTVNGAGSTWTQTGASSTILGTASGLAIPINVQNGGVFTTGTGSVTLNASATINIEGGTLDLRGPLVRNGGVINFTSGALSIVDNFTVGVGGLLGASVTLDATRRFTTSATTTIDAFRTLTLDGGVLTTGALVNNGVLAFKSGTLAVTGAGGFAIGTSGALGANVALGTGANLQVTNAATVASGANLTVDGGSVSVGSLANAGLVEHDRGALTVAGAVTNQTGADFFAAKPLTLGGAFTNQAGAQVTLENGSGRINGAGSLSNAGLLTGDGTFAVPVTNLAGGKIRAEAGRTLRFTAAFAPNAGDLVLQGGALDFAGAVTNSATGFISGRGALSTGGLTNQGQMAFSGGHTDIRGDVTLTSGARVVTSGAGAVTTFFDDVVHNGLEIFTGAGGSTVFFGAQSGGGSFTGTGTVYFIGDLRPGNSPASVLYEGDLVFGSATTLTLEIGGLTAGAEYDHLDVAGTLHADGLLKVALLDDFAPAAGDTFDFFDARTMAGAFDAIELPALAAGLSWDTSKIASTGAVAVVPEPGSGLLLATGLAWLGWRRRVRGGGV